MSKTVLVLRHAKAARDDPDRADFDRSLTKMGRRDAPAMGAWMRAHGLKPDLILCSDAKRAKETCEGIAEALAPSAPTLHERGLYMASASALLHRLRRLADSVSCVLLVGHNPGLQELAAALAGTEDSPELDRLRQKFPTCALARLDFTAARWQDVAPGKGRLALLVTPADLP
jgi:phosphohistidine phosphatase